MRLNPWVLRTERPPLVELSARGLVLAAQGADIIRVDQGAVDIPPPKVFVDRLAGGLHDPELHRYAPDPGLPELRAALARYAADRLGVGYDPDGEILVTAGANQACFAALMALVSPGDEVLLPAPWYFNHAMTLTALGAVPVAVPTRLEDAFEPTREAARRAITPRTRGILLVNPNNPTGARYDDATTRQLTELAVERDLWLLADQTYHEVHFGSERPLSPAAVPGARDRVVTTCSFSKSLGLAGWRLGFLGGPAGLVDQVLKVHDCAVICAGRPAQAGLLAALPEVARHAEEVRRTLRDRRDRLATTLHTAGLDGFAEPGGSLFLFLRLPRAEDDWTFCRRLLEERHVVAVPGSAFGPGGAGSIRISFGSTPADRLTDAAQRIASAG